MSRTFAIALLLTLPMSAAFADDDITIPASVPFGEDSGVSSNIKQECDLPGKLSADLKLALEKAGYTVHTGGGKKGDVLDLKIVGAVSGGSAFKGHQKSMTVVGKLIRNGKKIGNFTDMRNSMGGAWGGYKGSCTILHACAATISKDIAGWVKNPSEDSMLGDSR
jgi:hypothetical protein